VDSFIAPLLEIERMRNSQEFKDEQQKKKKASAVMVNQAAARRMTEEQKEAMLRRILPVSKKTSFGYPFMPYTVRLRFYVAFAATAT
jgi:hypothetical protein